MPVAAKFSEEFYARFGHPATDELVNYLNALDAAHNTDFDRRTEAIWRRFEDRLDERTAELEAKLGARIDRLEAKMEQRLAELRAELLKWMFLFWLGTIGTVIALQKL